MWNPTMKTVAGILPMVAITLPVRAEPADDGVWSIKDINETIAQTNFIVGSGCSGTLISLEHKLVLTNHHCIESFFKYVDREVVKDGEVKKVKREETSDVPLAQQFYRDFRNVGTTTLQAELIARKKTSDLALLRIRAETVRNSMASQVLPDGKKPQRGQRVWVVGNPRGLDATLTTGIISSMNRLLRVSWGDGAEVPFIQVDAGVNPGNSGGALYDSEGFLIGVPGAMVGDSSLGLAIPYTAIREFLSENCYEEVWKSGAQPHDVCEAGKKAKAEKE